MLNSIDLRAQFSRAAKTYEQVSVLQQEVARRLLEQLESHPISPSRIADLGCATALSSETLSHKFPKAQTFAVDFSHTMLTLAMRRKSKPYQCIAADMAQLPFESHSIDLIYSNLALAWCEPHSDYIREVTRLLSNNGCLLFSSFGPDTLYELRHCLNKTQATPQLHQFTDMHHLGDALQAQGYKNIVMSRDNFTLEYQNISDLLTDIDSSGSPFLSHQGHPATLSGACLDATRLQYESLKVNDKLPASYEVIYGFAMSPNVVSGQSTLEYGVAKIPLNDIQWRQR